MAANISKNSTSINEDAAKDYETSFALLYDFVDMFVVNVSCPNVVGLTALQDITFLSDIVDRLLDLRMYYDEYRPILLKVSPDLSHEQLDEIIDYCLRKEILYESADYHNAVVGLLTNDMLYLTNTIY